MRWGQDIIYWIIGMIADMQADEKNEKIEREEAVHALLKTYHKVQT